MERIVCGRGAPPGFWVLERIRRGVHGQALADDQMILIGVVSVKEIVKRWEICRPWEKNGQIVYKKIKTKSMFIEV